MSSTPPNLWDPNIIAHDSDHRPIVGAMARYVGAQFTAEEIWNAHRDHLDLYEDESSGLRPLAARIRALDIPTLAGTSFTVFRLSDVADALRSLLSETLHDIDWSEFGPIRVSRIKKYGLIHETLAAPMDEATQEPMVLELYGRLTLFNGQPAGIRWYLASELGRGDTRDDQKIGEMTFSIMRATYANTQAPGIGIRFYL